jgi:hypothetical protein
MLSSSSTDPESRTAMSTSDNLRRIARIETLIKKTGDQAAQDRMNLIDVLTDVMHYAEEKGLDFDDVLVSARNHFSDESTSKAVSLVSITPYDRAVVAINALDEEDLYQIKLDVQARMDED